MKQRTIAIRVFNACFVLLLLIASIAMLIVGTQLLAISGLVLALSGLTVSALITGESAAEMVTGFFEAIIDGLSAILEAIASLFS
jgi:hypothetical protein